jgi:hypothetical protein
MAFGGPTIGNAPIKNAARTPSSKPKIILRAFGRMDHTETAKHGSGGKGWLGVASAYCRYSGNDRINNVNVAQTQST